ncbi:hypothetical protein X474_25880 [Dethiosulfatarculus sandiegensis]|uniref:Uncharacterized protein n=1 Tax=Dethiosulfatarculus sandiegensis TaxID=1429043 RepID=A0A0D2G8I3_9BACT|nr:hypothetical protein X474_25880 [Dethiosulfatarculus sandiegensis]
MGPVFLTGSLKPGEWLNPLGIMPFFWINKTPFRPEGRFDALLLQSRLRCCLRAVWALYL